MSIKSGLNNKKSLYLLLPLNLAIWGYVGYKIYSAFNDNGPDFTLNTAAPGTAALETRRDSFTIFANYRDPFLENLHQPRPVAHHIEKSTPGSTAINKQTGAKTTGNKPAAANDGWPEIKYMGSVSNPQAMSKSVALISIAGTTYSLKAGEEVNGIKLIGFTTEQAEFKKGREKKSVRSN